jgi:hypothetical protein
MAMAAERSLANMKVGDLVKIRNYTIKKGRIIEIRGPLAPGGQQVYRVRVRRKPTPVDIELTADQITLIPTRGNLDP